MKNILFAYFMLFSYSLLLFVVYITRSQAESMDIPGQQNNQQEIDLVYYKVFPVHKLLKHTDIADCTVKPEVVSLRQKNHHSVLICKEKVNLLREKKTVDLWKKENRLHGFLLLDMPEMGIYHVKAHIISIKNASKFNGNNFTYSIDSHINPADSMRPVTGVFIRHVSNVRKYMLQNSRTGHISVVNVTPEHRFYVTNRQAFVPIANVSLSDKLITDTGEEVRIIADSKGMEQKNIHDKAHYPEVLKTVYNLEIYKKHMYFASDLRVLVHNVYTTINHHNGKINFRGEVDAENTGNGVFYRDDNTLQYIGEFKNGLPHGHGSMYNHESILFYEGDFVEGKSSGYGKLFSHAIRANGPGVEISLRYEGYFENNLLHGEGTLYFYGTEHVQLKGTFEKDDLVNGEVYELCTNVKGEVKWYGLRYRGDLKNGKYDGVGTYFKFTKDRSNELLKWQKGIWSEGKLVAPTI